MKEKEIVLLITSSLWRPLRGPLYDWPLAVLDASSADMSRDVAIADLITPKLTCEYCAPFWHPNHRWYYFRKQTTSDILVILQADSRKEGNSGTCTSRCRCANRMSRWLTQEKSSSGVIHTAFENFQAPKDCPPRESVEVSALMFWDENLGGLERRAGYPVG